MVLECENYSDLEIIVGTSEEFVLGYKPLKEEDGKVGLSQSFESHSHRASVQCVASGGRFMASGGADDNIQLYDMKLRKEMGVLMHHDKMVTCLAFAGKSHLLSGSDDGKLAIWRTGNWVCEKTLSAHMKSGVSAVAVHPSGKLCLTVGKDNSLKTWNLVEGTHVNTTNLHAQGEDVIFSDSGDQYAVLKLFKGGAQFSVDVYGTDVASVVYSIVPESKPSSVAFLVGDLIAVGTESGTVEVHRTSSKSLVCKFEAQTCRLRQLKAVKFSSGEMWIVIAASNGDISIWSYKKDQLAGKTIVAPKLVGTASSGCRLTSMVLLLTPAGAVEPQVKDKLEESKIVIPEVESKRGVVTIELEGSDNEDKKPEKIMDQICTLGLDGPLAFVTGHDKINVWQIQRLLKFLSPYLEDGIGSLEENSIVSKEQMLACKHGESKNSWFRCKVLSYDSKVIEVSLADFMGSSITFARNELRDLSSFNLPTLNLPPQKKLVYIYGIMAPDGWILEKVKKINSVVTTVSCLLDLNVLFQCKNMDFAEIKIDDTSIADILIQEECGGARMSGNDQKIKAERFWSEKDMDKVIDTYVEFPMGSIGQNISPEPTLNVKSVDEDPMMYKTKSLQCNERHEVLISAIMEPGQANYMPWSFFVQIKSGLIQLEYTNSLLQKYCEKAPDPLMFELQENTPVCAKYSVDDRWYRGTIIKLEGMLATVHFVDYGNREDVPLTKIKLANRQIVDRIPMQAIKCYLDGVSTNRCANQFMQEIGDNKVFILTIVNQLKCDAINVRLAEKSSANIFLNDILLLESLQTSRSAVLNILADPAHTPISLKGMGLEHSINKFNPASTSYCHREPSTYTINMTTTIEERTPCLGRWKVNKHFAEYYVDSSDWISSIDDNCARAETSSFGDPTQNSYVLSTRNQTIKIPEQTVKIGEQFSALLVYMETPLNFFVQPLIHSTTLRKMSASIANGLDDGPIQEAYQGEYCWAKFTEDNAWYRALVLEKLGDQLKVLFVDFGNTSVVPSSDTKPIKKEHAELPAQSIKCSMRGLAKTKWSEDKLRMFEKETSDAELKVLVVAKAKDTYSVILHKEGQCLNLAMGAFPDALQPINKLQYQILPVNTTHSNMTISWFVNPNKFSLHQVNSFEILRDIDIAGDKLPPLPLLKPNIGSLVHVIVNKKLLRGAVVALADNKCKVELLDYGRVLITNMDMLNALPEEFLAIPKQAIFCGLHGVRPVNGCWPKNGTNSQFDNIFSGEVSFTISVMSMLSDGKLEVKMTRNDGVDMAELLQERGFTAPIKELSEALVNESVQGSAEKAVPQAKWNVSNKHTLLDIDTGEEKDPTAVLETTNLLKSLIKPADEVHEAYTTSTETIMSIDDLCARELLYFTLNGPDCLINQGKEQTTEELCLDEEGRQKSESQDDLMTA